MASPKSSPPNPYRRPMFSPPDGLFAQCLAGSAALGLLVLVIVFIAPVKPFAKHDVEEIPERFAKLIVKQQKPPTPPPVVAAQAMEIDDPAPADPEVAEPAPADPAPVEPKVAPTPRKTRRDPPKKAVDPDAGKAGRARAVEEVTKQLATTTAAVEQSLASLNESLASSEPTTDKPRSRRSRRSRSVRGGRTGTQVASAGVADVATGIGLEGGGSISGDLVAIESISAADGSGSAGAAGGGVENGTGARPGVYRSNASLMAVVRKYAAGIRFCYENELKRSPHLEGKLQFTLTVAADGRVTAVAPTEDSLGSPAVVDCSLAQINDWAFPEIPKGDTTFNVPFVFTPPTGR